MVRYLPGKFTFHQTFLNNPFPGIVFYILNVFISKGCLKNKILCINMNFNIFTLAANSPPTLPPGRDRLSLPKRGGEGGEFNRFISIYTC